jgi:hypothetical protein
MVAARGAFLQERDHAVIREAFEPTITGDAPTGPVMPLHPGAAMVDRRILLFRPSSLIAAMDAVGSDFGRGLGGVRAGRIGAALLDPVGQSVLFRFRDGPPDATCRLSGAGLAAMLIAYCGASGIPLPKLASKAVLVGKRDVTLEFLVTLSTPPLALYRPGQ